MEYLKNRDFLAVIPLQNSQLPLFLLNIVIAHNREDSNLVCIHFGAFCYKICLSLVTKVVAILAVIVKHIIDPDKRKYKDCSKGQYNVFISLM
jgi:hypothetical protein